MNPKLWISIIYGETNTTHTTKREKKKKKKRDPLIRKSTRDANANTADRRKSIQ